MSEPQQIVSETQELTSEPQQLRSESQRLTSETQQLVNPVNLRVQSIMMIFFRPNEYPNIFALSPFARMNVRIYLTFYYWNK